MTITTPQTFLIVRSDWSRLIVPMTFVSHVNFGSKYESWGKSYVISPWGEIVGETNQDEEDLKEVVINYDLIKTIRTMLPILE